MGKQGRWRRWMGCIVVSGALAAALGACGSDDDGGSTAAAGGTGTAAADTTAADSGKQVRIAELVPQLDNNYTQANIKAVQEVADASNATVKVFNANFQPAEQTAQCQDVISSGQYEAIIVQPVVGSALIPCAKRAIDKGIKVVAIETPLGPDYNTLSPQVPGLSGSVFTTADYDGKNAARMIIEACKDKDPCEVGQLIGVAGFSFDQARDEVIDAELKSHPNIKIVARLPAHFQVSEGETAMRDMIQAHPNLNVLEVAGDQMALGAEKALQAVGKIDQVTIVGHGATKEGVEKVCSDPQWLSNGVMVPYETGKAGAEIAIAAVRGEQVPKTEINAAETFGPKGGVLTKDNCKGFKASYSVF